MVPPFADGENVAIEARDLTMRFGDFTAVDRVNFRIHRGEIFGFLGSNGCGKTTTMKMLTGLLPPSEGEAWLFGQKVDARDITTRRRVGYMSQAFSLYSELSVEQNLVLHARLFSVPESAIPSRVSELLTRFGLDGVPDAMPDKLSLGMRQRLSLAVALVHAPELLILDEPTSGVDPVARDAFWQFLVDLSRTDKVTIFISTHFMNEAERCDRISLMNDGQVLASDAPEEIVKKRGARTLEEAFIAYLKDADPADAEDIPDTTTWAPVSAASQGISAHPRMRHRGFNFARAFSYTLREALELRRDPVRLVMALFGSLILMLIMGYGITMDVNDLSYAVLDRDQTSLSQNYALNLSGSRYFLEHPPITDYADLDRRMRSGELSLAIEIPSGFARDVQRGTPVQIGAWIDGAMPQRAETVQGYVPVSYTHLDVYKRQGVIRAIEDAGIEVDFIAGTSMGALIGAIHAAGKLDDLEDTFQTFDWKKTVSFFDVILPKSGLFDGAKISDLVRAYVHANSIEALPKPFAAVATDIVSGEEVVIRSGDVIEAVRASISVPGIFTPVRSNGRILVDGGLTNPVPVSVARAMGADMVIAVDLNHEIIAGKNFKPLLNLSRISQNSELSSQFGRWVDSYRQAMQELKAKLLTRETPGAAQFSRWASTEEALPSIFEVLLASVNVMETRITQTLSLIHI